MIFGIFIIALCLISAGLKGTEHELGEQVQIDLLGRDGFLAWGGAIIAIGAIGWIPTLRTPSRYLLALLGVVMIVRNGGLFQSAQQALEAASAGGPAPSIPQPAINFSGGSSGGSSGGQGGPLATAGKVASIATAVAAFA